MNSKERFFAVLKNEFSPALRRYGFKGSGHRFQREIGEIIHVIGIQTNKYGGSCCVNLGLHLRFLPLTTGKILAQGEKIRAESCEFRWRLAPPGNTDYWWAFEEGIKSHLPLGIDGKEVSGSDEQARHLIKIYDAYGETRFQSVMTIEAVAQAIRIEDIERGWPVSPLYSFTAARAGLTMARIHKYLGDSQQARKFAQAGLSRIDRAKGLQLELEQFLNHA